MERFWRLAKTPIILLALVIILALAGKWGYEQVLAPVPEKVEPCVEQRLENQTLNARSVTVRIRNASDFHGKASDVSQALKNKGFGVTGIGNADAKLEKTTIYGHAADDPEVKLVADNFKVKEIVGDGRIDHSVEVHIGADYPKDEGMNADAPNTIKTNSDTICLLPPPAEQAPN